MALSSSSSLIWPQVTINYFEIQGDQYRDMIGSKSIYLSPIVDLSNINEWNLYSVTNQGWIQDSYIEKKGINNIIPNNPIPEKPVPEPVRNVPEERS